MGARGTPARKAVLKARAADMACGEEMGCGMGELRRALGLRFNVEILLCAAAV